MDLCPQNPNKPQIPSKSIKETSILKLPAGFDTTFPIRETGRENTPKERQAERLKIKILRAMISDPSITVIKTTCYWGQSRQPQPWNAAFLQESAKTCWWVRKWAGGGSARMERQTGLGSQPGWPWTLLSWALSWLFPIKLC